MVNKRVFYEVKIFKEEFKVNNNQEEINRLINEFSIQKRKDRKHLLKIEIAKATDRSVKRALQDILEDIEKKEKRNMFFSVIVIIIFILGIFYFVSIKGAGNNKLLTTTSSSTLKNSTKDSSSSVGQKNQKNISKENELSEDEVKEWVSAVWNKKYANRPNQQDYKLNIKTDSKDELVYVDVVEQNNENLLGNLRINADGQLEQEEYGNWTSVSNQFMDTSIIEPLEAQIDNQKINTKDLTSEQATEWVKKYRKQQGVTDEGSENVFETQLSKDNYLEIIVYSWNLTKIAKTRSSAYRVNQDGFLEQGSPDTMNSWSVISTEFIE